MTLVKWNNETRPAFPNLMENFFGKDIFDMIGNNGNIGSLPGVNVIENKDEFRIEVAVPGMKKEHFNINLEKNMLSISAEVENSSENENERYTRREFSFDSFRRSFALPDSAHGEKIKAKYTDGILHIVVPKKEEAKEKPARKIDIS